MEDGEPVLIDFGQAYSDVSKIHSLGSSNDPLFDAKYDVIITCCENNGAYAPKHDAYCGCIVPSKFDIFCLGSMLFEMLTGQVPTEGVMRLSTISHNLIVKHGSLKADLMVGMLLKD